MFLLRGHHVKNLRYSLYEPNLDFEEIMQPGKVKIVAGQLDIICGKCNDIKRCEKTFGTKESYLFDWMLGYASGTRVGNIYQTDELITLLKSQNRTEYFLREMGMMFLFVPVGFPAVVYDMMKPR